MTERDFEGKTSTRVAIDSDMIVVKHKVSCPEDEFEVEIRYTAKEAQALAAALLMKATELEERGIN